MVSSPVRALLEPSAHETGWPCRLQALRSDTNTGLVPVDMPHLTLEFSDFVAFPDDPVDVLARLHQMLSEIADIPISNCKGRAYRMGAYAVGVNASDSGFVHLEIRLLAGRPTEIKRTISLAALDVLKSVFLTADNPRDLQITVEICDIERESYSKHPPGTLSHP